MSDLAGPPNPDSDPAHLPSAVAWLRHLATDPYVCNVSNENRTRLTTVLAELDRLRVQRAAADTEIARRDETIEQLRHELASAEATIQFLDGITPAAPSLPIPTDQED